MKDFIQIFLFVTKVLLLALGIVILPVYLLSTNHYILAVFAAIVCVSVVVYVVYKEVEE